ncbi:hypothetical protein ACWEQL_05330 [Kitasatospora sp. NPDC004240]
MSALRPLLALAATAALALGGVGVQAGAARAAALPDEAQLRAALLTVEDVGSSFTEVPVEENPEDPLVGDQIIGCEDLVDLLKDVTATPPPTETWEATELVGRGDNPYITESLYTEDAGTLTADFATASDAMESCEQFTIAGDESGLEGTTFDVSPVDLGGATDAPAIRMEGEVFGSPVNIYLAIERFGPVAMAYTYVQQGDSGAEAAAEYYLTAVDKAEQVLQAEAGSTADDIGTAS